ncbi:MAG: DUF2254 domain-containing protein [Bacteroidetes bacterium]|nr:DUF2254 domain-containing protein [Bacteroidota bacterium]
MKKLLFFWKELMSTFWFLPVLTICCSVFLSVGLVYLDNNIIITHEGWIRFFLVNSSDSARSILSTISGAMIGVAGTVFSVTLVALTLASSQFGSRLIKNFMYVRLNQIVLGSYISTYLYCLLILNAIKDVDGYIFIPSISILIAILAAIANIVLLIVFIHQIAISLQADKIVSDISDFISTQVVKMFPEKMGEENDDLNSIDIEAEIAQYGVCIQVKAPRNGYLQYIDSETLMTLVTEYNGLFKLNQRPGGFLVEGIEIGVLHLEKGLEEKEMKKILNQFVISKTKTPQQDLEYSIHQMVEIAARALSPGVNDPYTAIACIDNLTATMAYLAQVDFPSKYRFDDDQNLRVIADSLDFEGVLNAAFNQIRQFSGGSTAVIIRLMEAMETINGFVKNEKHKKHVIKHAQMILNIGEQTINEKNDLEDLVNRSKRILP